MVSRLKGVGGIEDPLVTDGGDHLSVARYSAVSGSHVSFSVDLSSAAGSSALVESESDSDSDSSDGSGDGGDRRSRSDDENGIGVDNFDEDEDGVDDENGLRESMRAKKDKTKKKRKRRYFSRIAHRKILEKYARIYKSSGLSMRAVAELSKQRGQRVSHGSLARAIEGLEARPPGQPPALSMDEEAMLVRLLLFASRACRALTKEQVLDTIEDYIETPHLKLLKVAFFFLFVEEFFFGIPYRMLIFVFENFVDPCTGTVPYRTIRYVRNSRVES